MSTIPGFKLWRAEVRLRRLQWAVTLPKRRIDVWTASRAISGRWSSPLCASFNRRQSGNMPSRDIAWIFASSLSLALTGAGSLGLRTLSRYGADVHGRLGLPKRSTSWRLVEFGRGERQAGRIKASALSARVKSLIPPVLGSSPAASSTSIDPSGFEVSSCSIVSAHDRPDETLDSSGVENEGSADALRAGPAETGFEVSDSSSCLSSTLSSLEEMLRTSVDMLCMFELSVCRQLIICSRGSDVWDWLTFKDSILANRNVREGKELSKRLFHKCFAARARKKADEARANTWFCCFDMRHRAKICAWSYTFLVIFKTHYKILAVEYRKLGQTRWYGDRAFWNKIIFSQGFLIFFFVWKVSENYEKRLHFCAHAQ